MVFLLTCLMSVTVWSIPVSFGVKFNSSILQTATPSSSVVTFQNSIASSVVPQSSRCDNEPSHHPLPCSPHCFESLSIDPTQSLSSNSSSFPLPTWAQNFCIQDYILIILHLQPSCLSLCGLRTTNLMLTPSGRNTAFPMIHYIWGIEKGKISPLSMIHVRQGFLYFK